MRRIADTSGCNPVVSLQYALKNLKIRFGGMEERSG
jgi:hypothetical protein